jgi:hypothetical protein
MKIILHLSVILCSFSYAQQIEVTTPKYTIPDSMTIADGTKISREELTRRCNMAWENSFGKLTKEENDLLFSVPITISVEAEAEQPVDETDLYMKKKSSEKSIIEPKKTAITPPSPNG